MTYPVRIPPKEYEALVEIARIAEAMMDDALCNRATSAEAFLRLDLKVALENYRDVVTHKQSSAYER